MPENVTSAGDLYLSTSGPAGWTGPVNLRCVNSAGSDLLPRFGPDGLLLFGSSRSIDGRQTDIYAIRLERLLKTCASDDTHPVETVLLHD